MRDSNRALSQEPLKCSSIVFHPRGNFRVCFSNECVFSIALRFNMFLLLLSDADHLGFGRADCFDHHLY